ncbi:kin-1 [Symbiodinium necroappetens]|uniref:Kin-1 protein n=1 Tax=Symbiodinium necroappetens TaxID=1628268 RepID=A0A813AIA8_9DINO|nr:kin-1 [Symbiodinium necroappetens]
MGSSPCACVSGFEFRRVKFAKYKPDGKFYTVKPRAESGAEGISTPLFPPFMKKHEIIKLKLKQVDHINNEKRLMAQISYPFIVDMPASQFSGWAIAKKIILSTLQLGEARQHGAFVEGGVCKDEQSKFYALQVRR